MGVVNRADQAVEADETPVSAPTPTSTTPVGTTMALTTHHEATKNVQGQQMKLLAASCVLVSLTLIAAILLVLREKSSDDSPAGSDLTYVEPTTIPTELTKTTTVTTMAATTQAPTAETTKTRRELDARTLLCTYGFDASIGTVFPEDGLCDLIFFDSAYKNNVNIPGEEKTFGAFMKAFLSKASRYKNTELGVAFGYRHLKRLSGDLKKTNSAMLDVFWKSDVFHFGIIDMPSANVSYDNIIDVFSTLKDLSLLAMERPDTLGQPYIVLGAIPLTYAEFYAAQMRDMYTPTLFISQGHYAFGDNTVADCKVFPPTTLRKPLASKAYTYDLTDAVAALQQIQDKGVSTKWLVSLSMKGRWTKVKLGFPMELTSECNTDRDVKKSFGRYVDVCTDGGFCKTLQYVQSHETMYTHDMSRRVMFVYDNEEGLCRKMCQVKSKNNDLQFGIAIYDLEYEDQRNTCSNLNVYGAFSRLKMAHKVVDYFRKSAAGGGSCEDNVPCSSKAIVCD